MADKIIFVGYIVDNETEKRLVNMDPHPAVQTINFSRTLFKTLNKLSGVTESISMCPVQDYPLTKKLYFPTNSFSYNGSAVKNVRFINCIFLKQFTRLFGVFINLYKAFRKNDGIIFHHGTHTPSLIAALLIKWLFKVRLYIVLTDPPSLNLKTDSHLRKLLKALDRKLNNLFVKNCDGGIALSHLLVPKGKTDNYILTPGIIDETKYYAFHQLNSSERFHRPERKKKIIYAGSLEEQYGVMTLAKAVANFPNDYTLELYGSGSLKDKLNKVAENVKYHGFLSGDDYLSTLLKADILVNCRPSEIEESQFSFPSKLLEYALTGKCVLTTKLSTIPTELRQYYLFFEDSTLDGFIKTLNELKDSKKEELSILGKGLQSFVINNYSETAFSEKLKLIIPKVEYVQK